MATSIPIALRASTGINLVQGPPNYGKLEKFTPIESKSCRIISFSPNGKYLAYVFGTTLKIVRTDIWTDVATIDGNKAYFLAFSPKSTYLVSWELYEITKKNPEGSPNLKIYKCENGEFVKCFVHKSQTSWEPKWSKDEKLFSKIVNQDVVFYEDNNFEQIVHRINCFKINAYSISPFLNAHYIITHTLGTKGQPSFARLFKYPNFDGLEVVASKSFFQADKVDFYWNNKGTSALLLASTEQDKTGKSYYGKQSLHFVDVDGTTNMVSLSKEGPIYSVSWSPKGKEFAVVYGLMPAKATIFKLNCEPLFELATGPYNAVHYNPHGNILLLGGFGNLRGNIETWNMLTKKLIGKCDAPDTTLLEWSPDGIHFLTATTAPRLRIGNGFKIWHYSGALLFENFSEEKVELYDVLWQKYLKGTFPDPTIKMEKVDSIATKQVQASTQAYRPPSARNKQITFNLHDDNETDSKLDTERTLSKNAMKLKKKRESKRARKALEFEGGEKQEEANEAKISFVSDITIVPSGDPEKDKKMRNIKKRLDGIQKLKNEQAQGKTLELNQLSKFKDEASLRKELKKLQLSKI